MLRNVPPIKALMSMPCASVGVGMTMRSVLDAGARAGLRCELHTSAFEGMVPDGLTVRATLPELFRSVPFSIIKPATLARVHRRFLAELKEGDVAYLWPSCPLGIYERLARRGATVVTEAVNSRMETTKPILDAAYEALGLEPSHPITDARIAEQNRRHALCSAVVSPSPATDASMIGTPLEHRCIHSSYGTWVPADVPERVRKRPGDPVEFVFVGYASIRKGTHYLLEAWRRMPDTVILRIVGDIEPAIATLFADVLDQANVMIAGFSDNVARDLARADVALMPSLEEGDPIATYEAAASGLAVIATPAGAGRIGAETGAITIVDAADPDMLRDTIAEYARSDDLRRDRGSAAREAVLFYDWNLVARRRFNAMARFLRA